MKRIFLYAAASVTLLLFYGCASEQSFQKTQQEAEVPRVAVKEPPREISIPPPVKPQRKGPASLQCTEDTHENFNRSGIDAIPFIRVSFFDTEGTGVKDMIAGSKDGFVYLYKNLGDPQVRRWRMSEGYFAGIKVGAFSSPAMGDLDGDGEAELVVGTGGFSSDSGRILFFRNVGSKNAPQWKKVEGVDLKIGNDAAVTVVDYNFDGKPDIIATNSSGKLFFFKNVSVPGKIKFVQEKLLDRSFGMYAVPAAIKVNDVVFLTVGNSLGNISLFELRKNGAGVSIKESRTKPSAGRFVSPSFADLLKKDRFDLIVADGDGVLSYFENRNYDFSVLEKNQDIFSNRIFAGPACAPTVCTLGEQVVLVVGNMDGTLKLYEYQQTGEGLPWVERKDYLKGIKVSGFSRGIITQWEGKEVLVVGQSNGDIRAFMNVGSDSLPHWREEKRFFQGIRIKEHTTPSIFDFGRDGKWQLIIGAADGRLYAYRVREIKDHLPVWEKIEGAFDGVKVEGFSAPTLARDGNTLYLFVGQEDGRIRTYTSELKDEEGNRSTAYSNVTFTEKDYLKDIRMHNHSSPSIRVKDDMIEMVSGDYDGNIRHFRCSRPDLSADKTEN